MSEPRWREESIGCRHDRAGFDCGSSALNVYLRRYARQNHESGGAKNFVAIRPEAPARILGYYSISPAPVEFARVPVAVTRRLGRYEVPVFRLGRLAVSISVQGQQIGSALLFAAKDERAAGWYEHFGALRLLDDPLRLILPLPAISEALAGG